MSGQAGAPVRQGCAVPNARALTLVVLDHVNDGSGASRRRNRDHLGSVDSHSTKGPVFSGDRNGCACNTEVGVIHPAWRASP